MGDVELDVAAALGAEAEASFQVLSIYLPNKDRHGTEFDASPWIKGGRRAALPDRGRSHRDGPQGA